jgi:arginine exporter protein ArgO
MHPINRKKSAGKKTALTSYASSLFASFIACLCCSLPLLALVTGVAGAEVLMNKMERYPYVFDGAGILVLVFAGARLWKQKRRGLISSKGFWTQVLVIILLYSAMTLILRRTMDLWMSANDSMHGQHSSHSR